MKKTNIFWIGYSDLMTSLFFIMLVLFVITVAMLRKSAQASDDAVKEINRVVTATQGLDSNYFFYDEQSMRYRLNTDIVFQSGNYNLLAVLNDAQRKDLIHAGELLYVFIKQISLEHPDINYLLLIEGNTQRSFYEGQWNYLAMPEVGYRLSYNRALALVAFWENNNINFRGIENCEVLIVGSGYFGKSRINMISEGIDSHLNRRFSIQLTPKIGRIEI